MPKIVFLATDVALWALFAGLAAYVWKVRRTPDLRAIWRSVLRDPPAMSALVPLTVFLSIAALDSLHFRPLLPPAPGAAADAPLAYATRTYSVLDLLAKSKLDSAEKTYSAPLSYRQFTKESMELDGRPVRDFPRLVFGGAHLRDPASDWRADLAMRSLRGLAGGALAAGRSVIVHRGAGAVGRGVYRAGIAPGVRGGLRPLS